jgi:glycosyltransferase involved in cell wall biosynthesis
MTASDPSASVEVPAVSIIVPTSGDRTSLTEALRSVIEQTHSRWECIVVVDGVDVVTDVPADPRIRVIRHARPFQGPAAARNTGMAGATGMWIAFLDDDDLLTPDRLERALLGADETGVHLCGLQAIDEHGQHTGRASSPHDEDSLSLIRRPPHVGQALVRRTLAVQFDPGLRVGEDVEWWIRMASAGPITSGSWIGYLQREHAGARIGVDPGVRYACRRAIVAMHGETLNRDRQARAYHLHRVASAALHSGASGRCAYWAAAAMVARPSWLSAKLLGRGLIGWVTPRLRSASDAR